MKRPTQLKHENHMKSKHPFVLSVGLITGAMLWTSTLISYAKPSAAVAPAGSTGTVTSGPANAPAGTTGSSSSSTSTGNNNNNQTSGNNNNGTATAPGTATTPA